MKKQIEYKLQKNQDSVLIFIFMAGVLLAVFCQISSAQITRTRPTPQVSPTPPQRKTTIFKGAGREEQDSITEQLKQIPAIQPLSPGEKRNLFAGALNDSEGVLSQLTGTIKIYATLNAQNSFVRDKALINFYNADFVGTISLMSANPVMPFVHFKGVNKEQSVRIRLKPAYIRQLLMVDCGVFTGAGGGFFDPPFKITGPDGSVTEKTINGGGHLLAFLLAQDTTWQTITIRRDSEEWTLLSCEVTDAANQ